MKKPLLKIVIAFVFALVLPVISITVFQFIQRDHNEALLDRIYERQLDILLFAVNQNCWDNFNLWVNELATGFRSQSDFYTPEDSIQQNDSEQLLLQTFVDTHPFVKGLFIRKSYGKFAIKTHDQLHPTTYLWQKQEFEGQIEKMITSEKERILKSIRRARQGYVRPTAVSWPYSENRKSTLLIFPLLKSRAISSDTTLAGIFIDNLDYIDEIVGRKFSSMDEGNFIFAVRDMAANELIYSTENVESQEFERSESLWILPGLNIEIKLTGTTLAELTEARAQTNIFLLVAVNLILILGVIYIIRNVYLEMVLARKEKDFVANVSHELRTPLALIRMFAELMEMGRVPSEEKKQRYYKSIMAESTRLTQLINNILDFSKIESKKKTYQFVPTDIAALVDETLELYKFHASQKGVEITYDAESNISNVNVDPEAIKQAFVNLVDNAIKFSEDQKVVNVHLGMENGYVELSVQDFGMGIQPSEQKKIFDKFYRVESSLVHNTKGSGLGLALVKNIIEQHQGQIKLQSKPGEGSTFTLLIPRSMNQGE